MLRMIAGRCWALGKKVRMRSVAEPSRALSPGESPSASPSVSTLASWASLCVVLGFCIVSPAALLLSTA